MARRNNQELAFPALSIEGGLLAPDFLNKVAHLEASEQSEADYDIPRGLKLRDEIGRYWKIAQNLWQDFAAKRARTDLNSQTLTVKELLEPLLHHVFCFGDLKAIGQIHIEERIFPIGFAASEGKVPAILAAHDQSLDKSDTRFGDGVRRRSPFLLAQEYLNAGNGALWAIVSNGLKLRILRDNPSLTRPAYIEADLEAIFTEGLYPDFTALWLLSHSSRFGKVGAEPTDCPLERWRNTAQEDGIRARDRLRIGVTEALRSLGTGFLEHQANTELLRRLETGELSTQSYFEQLLRLIYRFIFLATIEDRELVFAPDVTADIKARYLAGYSLTRLRQLAARRRSYDRHADLWRALTITFTGLGKGQPALGLPALGGLFADRQCPDLDTAQLDNSSLLSALFNLCFFREGAVLSRVNYRDMDSEELGSVYESLLELVPNLTLTTGFRRFDFICEDDEESTKGNARKLTGSYYTPDSLVQELVKSTLEPVIEKALTNNRQEPVKALLGLSICDPACGSGHFLLAAARRIAEEVTRLNAADGNPLPADYRRALRDVVAHCIYGVDKNPMAVELARTALWLEAYTPELPLTFLDAHLRCGDALLGILDPGVLNRGIPEKAFSALSGDDKEVVKRIKKANRDALKAIEKASACGSQFSLGLEAEQDAEAFEHLPDDTLEAVEAKHSAFTALQVRLSETRARLAADIFIAAFVLPKTLDNETVVPTSQDLWLVQNGSAPRPGVENVAHRTAEVAQAFHWWQAFPHVHAKGGFDVLLGNPPWEVSQLGEEEYFSSRSPAISKLRGAARKNAIEDLANTNATLWVNYLNDKRRIEAVNNFFRHSNRFSLTNIGKINLYSLFAESFLYLKCNSGRAGFIVPSGIGTDDSNKKYFQAIVENNLLVSFFGFDNAEKVFPSVHADTPFALVTLGCSNENIDFAHYLLRVSHLGDCRRRYVLNKNDFAVFNPNTRTCPIFRSSSDANVARLIYKNSEIFVRDAQPNNMEGWDVALIQNFFSSSVRSDAEMFVAYEDAGKTQNLAPVLRGTMIDQFDHRNATYQERTGTFEPVHDKGFDFATSSDKYVPARELNARLEERSWNRKWLIGWRDITNATNWRTLIASVFPAYAADDTLSLILPREADARYASLLLANLNSIVLDFVAQIKVGGTHIRKYVISQFPVIVPARYRSLDIDYIVPRVLELTYTAHDLAPWAADLGYAGSPFPWNPERRALLRAELDAYYARLYGLTRDELRYILDPADVMGEGYPSETFRVLKKNEISEFGEYRTRRLVLEAWDRLEAGTSVSNVPFLSEQGLIGNADEADFAGIIVEIIRQHPDGISSGDIQTLVAYARRPDLVSHLIDQAPAARLATLMTSVCRIDAGATVQLIPNILHRLQSAGVCRSIKRGEAVVYGGNTGALPADVSCNQEHKELAGLLLMLDAKRKAIHQVAEEEIGKTEQRGAA